MFFLYHKKSRPTGEILAKTLQINHGLEFESEGDSSFLIRWGSRVDPGIDDDFSEVLNSAQAIKNASNKLDSLYMMDVAGVNVPSAVLDFEEALETFGYPIIGRRLYHARGTDINLILQRRDSNRSRSDYFIPYIPTNREYRIHVVRDKVIRIQGKYLDFPEQAVSHIRNYEHGYRFRSPRLSLRPERLDTAKLAVSSLGLDFGAVDLIIADDGQCYVLEVNTAPSCSRRTGLEYIKEFSNILGVDDGQIALQELANLENEERDTEEEEDGDS